MSKRIAIIGGGAAGLATACAIGNGCTVTLYERNGRIGKKLLSTGNGRCNLFNMNLSDKHMSSQNPELIHTVLCENPAEEAKCFFDSLGLFMREEGDGRVYPLSNQASSVLDILRYKAAEKGVNIRCEFCVTKINKTAKAFELLSSDGEVAEADIVVLACGGKAAPKTGSDGTGYKLAETLGHTKNPLSPSLVALKSDTSFTAALKGIRSKVTIRLLDAKGELAREQGEIQFTDYGISGIAAMQLSRHLSKDNSVEIDFTDEYSEEYIFSRLSASKKVGKKAYELALGIVQRRLSEQIIKYATFINPSTPAEKLTQDDIKSISHALKALSLPVKGTLSWDNAQVTSGGIPLSEIDCNTMQSRLTEGLYIAGEMLDCDGECGGYNLGWAWITALRVAAAINEVL